MNKTKALQILTVIYIIFTLSLIWLLPERYAWQGGLTWTFLSSTYIFIIIIYVFDDDKK